MERTEEKYNVKITKGLHPSKKILGYYYKLIGDEYFAFCGFIELQKYKTKNECIKSFENRQ